MVLKNAFDSAKDRLASSRAVKSLLKARLSVFLQEQWFLILYLVTVFILSSGLVNAIMEGSRLPPGSPPLVRRRGIQSASETLIYFFIFALGTGGLYIAYSGARQQLRRRVSDFYLVVGISLVLVGMAVGLTVLSQKGF